MHPPMTGPHPSAKIAFLEDDAAFAEQVGHELAQLGYDVSHFSSGNACLSHLMDHEPDVCLFDWHLPDMTGPNVMALLRQVNRLPPVIFMTGNDAEQDVAQALLAGADDYIVKPPVVSVLHARIQALLRRSQRVDKLPPKEQLGHLSIDHKNKVVLRNGAPVPLTGTETLLAFELFMQRGRIVTRQQLNQLLGIDDVAIQTRRLDVHISHLRSKLALNATHGWKLSSVYQRGYRLEFLWGE